MTAALSFGSKPSRGYRIVALSPEARLTSPLVRREEKLLKSNVHYTIDQELIPPDEGKRDPAAPLLRK